MDEYESISNRILEAVQIHHAKFDSLELRMARMEGKIDGLGIRLTNVEESVSGLKNDFNEHQVRLERHEVSQQMLAQKIFSHDTDILHMKKRFFA
ncbi:hypothetical protein SAMN04487866_101571 [Thermoactinomyces sp. DSM 45891]|uniref:hypothetical protein n=1 Tax=Thermoactinomyces sp. DSM 45891 TaxID=1761907 RepID=UPI00091CD0A0|nr:hypothetical protein [Thermoactinomyces sp. DSM 45891]SFX11235.1 hypothetical protein SAMN04487866_101571 [Thermoactinomyces sp. DSM 45891]